MPSWLKKRIQVLKRDLISHIVIVGKSQTKFQAKESSDGRLCDGNNERIANNTKSPIQKIRNDLKAQLPTQQQPQQQKQCVRNKSDMNAYRDYAKWRDQVLISQNNCALRCIKEEKINNIDNNVVDSQCMAAVATVPTSNVTACATAVVAIATNKTECISSVDSRQNNADDKSTSRDDAADDANCDSESEFPKKNTMKIKKEMKRKKKVGKKNTEIV